MVIKRINAANIREAMREVREELGPNAVILSNRRVDDGIEIIAAVDFDEGLLGFGQGTAAAAELPKPLPTKNSAAIEAALKGARREGERDKPASDKLAGERRASERSLTDKSEAKDFAALVQAAVRANAKGESDPVMDDPRHNAALKALLNGQGEARPPSERAKPPPPPPKAASPRPEPAPLPPQSPELPARDPLLMEMRQQINAVHSLLSQQLAGLAWGDLGRRQPQLAALLKRLTDFGLAPPLALQLAQHSSGEEELDTAWQQSLQALASGLTTTEDDILTNGGVVALIGPTGVGKTTTVAKLSARYTLLHGPGKVALITTDSYRIGAFDQLNTYGMILKTPVRLCSDTEELQLALDEFSDKSLILIDTAGMSQRDLRLSRQLSMLDRTPVVKNYVVLAANAQTESLYETVQSFQVPLAGCILTKLDEASQLGGALSVIYEHRLPLAYVSDGQRVPEELHPARVEHLLKIGETLVNAGSGASEEEMLALTFGRGVANVSF